MMINLLWAVVDIETTGANPRRDAITEISVKILDNFYEVETWSSLVNPHLSIPPKIQAVTGITNEMVAKAPSFDEIAWDLATLLDDKLFVAHNVKFDYAFIRHAFERMQVPFSAQTLCTVRLSRKLYPEQRRHSLSHIIERHDIEVKRRHRASDDVEALHQFIDSCLYRFGMVSLLDTVGAILKHSNLPPNLETNVDDIPNTPGVYLFFDGLSEIPLYVGKSITLRTRILSHFASTHSQTKELRIAENVHRIEWIETAGELEALLLESCLIKEHMPIYNRRLRRKRHLFSIHLNKEQPYWHLNIAPQGDTDKDEFGAFSSRREARDKLQQLIDEHRLCPKLCGLEKSPSRCFARQLKRCDGACESLENPKDYNAKVRKSLRSFEAPLWPFKEPIVIEETCAINKKHTLHLIDNWQYLGATSDLSEVEKFLSSKPSMQTDKDAQKILQRFVLNSIGSKKIKKLKSLSQFKT